MVCVLVPEYAKVSPLFEGYGDPDGSGDGFVGGWVGGGFIEPPPPPPQETNANTIVAAIENKKTDRMVEMVAVTARLQTLSHAGPMKTYRTGGRFGVGL